MSGAAALDPVAGRIVGYAPGRAGAPGRAHIFVNDVQALSLVAAAPATQLGRDLVASLGPPPSAICAFSACLPAASRPAPGAPAELRVEAGTGDVLFRREFADGAALARYVEGSVMSDSVFLRVTRLRAGAFSGRVTVPGGGPKPDIDLRLKGEIVGRAQLTGGGETYDLAARLPPEALGDGVNVVDFTGPGGEVLTRYPVSAGEALAGDLAAEVASLRAELDHLKGAFRNTLAGGVIARDERPMIIAELLTHVDNLLEMRDRAAAVQEIEAAADEDEEWEIG